MGGYWVGEGMDVGWMSSGVDGCWVDVGWSE